jgi:hypothetical protein
LVLLVPFAIYGASRVFIPAGPVGFAVLGDHADEVRADLGVSQNLPAAITIVLLNRWESLPYMPDFAAICGADCGKSKAGQISVTEMRYRRTRKTVFVHMPDFGGFDAGKDCIIARVAQELRGMRVTAPLPCAPDVPRKSHWQLPAGLGRI